MSDNPSPSPGRSLACDKSECMSGIAEVAPDTDATDWGGRVADEIEAWASLQGRN